MKIIVPMAGRGSRLRPHTLTVPKPLIPIAGKPIVQRLVEDITKVVNEKVDEIAFIIGDFGIEIENKLISIANDLGAKGTIYYQDAPLGTAHAIACAKKSLKGPVVVAFADTLFKADFTLDAKSDGVIWVKQVEDPSAFGVVKVDKENVITDFIEKPAKFISDLAIIGIYYFKDGENLRSELEYLIDNNIIKGGEYQLTDALENMKAKGLKLTPGKVDAWMDCGNKDATVDTNKQTLGYEKGGSHLIAKTAIIENSIIIEPCFIGENVVIKNSKIGPFVSIGIGTTVENSNIENSLIQNNASLKRANIENSMVGNQARYSGTSRSISIGDYSVFE